LTKPLANPVGFRLGGELPESIALSMISEAHAVLEKADGLSISSVLKQ
jgi:xanthine/CO dehydrogenase XdhC/CoxF family maturation factor